MIQTILQFFEGVSPAWTTILIAAMPIVEVRGAVPVALELLHLPVALAMLYSFLGSLIPAILLPTCLEIVEKPLRKQFLIVDRFFVWVKHHVEHRYTDKYRTMGALGLIVFVAIPLPMTGVWTGALAAWLFLIPKRYAIPAIFVGTALATLIVTGATVGGFALFRAVV
ncbi:TPA: ligand-binding protein SH3 [Candidatus Uhrbacteria bacterium]|nr:ligand-binding protein SH3 [Candidatus Uhrbacteria bacterium]